MKFKLFLFENSNQKDLKYLGEIEFTEEDLNTVQIKDNITFYVPLLSKLSILIEGFKSK